MIKKVKYQSLALILGGFCFYCFISSHDFISEFIVRIGISPYLLKALLSLSFPKVLTSIISIIAILVYDFIFFVTISTVIVFSFVNRLVEKYLLNSLIMTLGAFLTDKFYFKIMHTQTFDYTYFQLLMFWSVNKPISILIMTVVITFYFIMAILLSKKISKY